MSSLPFFSSFLSLEKLGLLHKYSPGVVIMLLSCSALPFDNVKKTVKKTEFGNFQRLGLYPQFKVWWLYHCKKYIQHANSIWERGQWIAIESESLIYVWIFLIFKIIYYFSPLQHRSSKTSMPIWLTCKASWTLKGRH